MNRLTFLMLSLALFVSRAHGQHEISLALMGDAELLGGDGDVWAMWVDDATLREGAPNLCEGLACFPSLRVVREGMRFDVVGGQARITIDRDQSLEDRTLCFVVRTEVAFGFGSHKILDGAFGRGEAISIPAGASIHPDIRIVAPEGVESEGTPVVLVSQADSEGLPYPQWRGRVGKDGSIIDLEIGLAYCAAFGLLDIVSLAWDFPCEDPIIVTPGDLDHWRTKITPARPMCGPWRLGISWDALRGKKCDLELRASSFLGLQENSMPPGALLHARPGRVSLGAEESFYCQAGTSFVWRLEARLPVERTSLVKLGLGVGSDAVGLTIAGVHDEDYGALLLIDAPRDPSAGFNWLLKSPDSARLFIEGKCVSVGSRAIECTDDRFCVAVWIANEVALGSRETAELDFTISSVSTEEPSRKRISEIIELSGQVEGRVPYVRMD